MLARSFRLGRVAAKLAAREQVAQPLLASRQPGNCGRGGAGLSRPRCLWNRKGARRGGGTFAPEPAAEPCACPALGASAQQQAPLRSQSQLRAPPPTAVLLPAAREEGSHRTPGKSNTLGNCPEKGIFPFPYLRTGGSV